tara:strand:- start:193 stop:1095 length:903 start_codon:yes stop_codon:yes gene_type:complete
MKILITGGAGFVGYHLTKELLGLKHQVYILDDLSTGYKRNVLKKAKFLEDSILNEKIISKYVKKCDLIFHLAAKVELQKSIINPEECLEVNLVGTAILVKYCYKFKKRLVFASSCSVYPNNIEKKLSENIILDPTTPYSISKAAGENLINFYSKNFFLNSVILRFFNIYGERQNVKSEYAAVIPKFIDNAIKNKQLKLFGHGKQSRDFINVKDVVNAYIKLGFSNKKGVFNVGSGESTTIKELANMIIKKASKGRIKNLPSLEGDAKFSCANINKIKSAINYSPKISLGEGLDNLIKRKL